MRTLITLLFFSLTTLLAQNLPEVTVYKSKFCGCCGMWIEHMQANGFKVKTIVTEDMDAVKKNFNIPSHLSSCHTAIIGEFIVEGHTPASDIISFLKNPPAEARGLTVPGMPLGSPGMEQGNMKQPYKVYAFTKDNRAGVYAEH